MSILSNVSDRSLRELASRSRSSNNIGGEATAELRAAARLELGERVRDTEQFATLSDKQLLARWDALRGKTDIASRTTVHEIIVELGGRAHAALFNPSHPTEQSLLLAAEAAVALLNPALAPLAPLVAGGVAALFSQQITR